MRKRKKNRGLLALGWTAAILVLLLFGAMVYAGFRAERLLPDWTGYQWLPVTQGDMGSALPEGALAIVDRRQMPQPKEVAAYRDEEGRVSFGRVASIQDGICRLVSDQGKELGSVEEEALLGAVHLYVSGLGGAVTFLHTYRLTVAAAAVIYLLALLGYVVTRGPRKRAKRRRELIELFAYYGEKYDMEESGIDY